MGEGLLFVEFVLVEGLFFWLLDLLIEKLFSGSWVVHDYVSCLVCYMAFFYCCYLLGLADTDCWVVLGLCFFFRFWWFGRNLYLLGLRRVDFLRRWSHLFTGFNGSILKFFNILFLCFRLEFNSADIFLDLFNNPRNRLNNCFLLRCKNT